MLIIGKQYKVIGSSETIYELIKIQDYPASGFPEDYLFKYISGGKDIFNMAKCNSLNFNKSDDEILIPFPKYLIQQLTFKNKLIAV